MKRIIEVEKVHPDSISTVNPKRSLKDLSFKVVSNERKTGSCFLIEADCTAARSLMKNTGAIPKSINTTPVSGPINRAP